MVLFVCLTDLLLLMQREDVYVWGAGEGGDRDTERHRDRDRQAETERQRQEQRHTERQTDRLRWIDFSKLYLPSTVLCQMKVTVGDSDLCCCV